MRQASWEEMFREGEARAVVPQRPWWSRLAIFSWEDLITLAIVLIAFLAVVQSIDSADWVPEMPSLYSIAFLGLGAGLILARSGLNQALAHLLAIGIGAAGVIVTSSGKLSGSLPDRTNELIDRLHAWVNAFTSSGISNDNLPFVLLVVALTYLTAYISAWSIFRWYNAWLGLVPGGLALLTNISYLPGQKSFAILFYLFCAILLVARVNLLRQERTWRRKGTGYPDLISLHVLNVTVWVGLALLALAWVMPVGNGSGAFYSLWSSLTAPAANQIDNFGRVFSAIDSKKGGTIHRFGSTLPLQGKISLGGGEVMRVNTAEPSFLRAQSYDFYTAQGWKVGPSAQITTSAWPALKALQGPEDARRQFRRFTTIQVDTSKKASVLVSNGQPLDVSIDSRVVFGPDPSDVTSIRPPSQLDEGHSYKVNSTLSNASAARLRTAPTAYPSWTSAYTQLPADLPQSISRKTLEVTAGADNMYDKASQIEQFLRTLAVDTKIPAAPPKRDSVAYFLFDLGRGYFDYHASAMVVMLRTMGVPSRLAVGYTVRPQDRIPDTNNYVVSEANSFAWPEVYFPGLGWIEFNPTPSEPRVSRPGTDDQEFLGATNEEFLDEDIPFDPNATPVDPAAGALDSLQVNDGSHLVSRIILSVLVLVVGITVVGGGIFQYSWQRGLGGLAYPVQVWEKTLRLAKWAHVRPLPQETPREVVTRLRKALPEVDGLDYMGDSFIRSRYGQKELAPAERERLREVWQQARNKLLRRVLRWK